MAGLEEEKKIDLRPGAAYILGERDLVAGVEEEKKIDMGIVVDKAKTVLTVESVKSLVQFGPNVPEDMVQGVCEDVIEFAGSR